MATDRGFEREPAWLYRGFAIHREGNRRVKKAYAGLWCISHADTGLALPSCYAFTVYEAQDLVDELASAADWSPVRRGKIPGEVIGFSDEMRGAVAAVIEGRGLRDQFPVKPTRGRRGAS
jgi:hypothetical protein